jgi:hypothetical protein
MTLIPLPDPLRVWREQGYQLKIFDPTGKAMLREFSRGVPGIAGDIQVTAHPQFGCIGCTFSARTETAGLEGAEVLQLFLDAGDGLKPVFYGSLTDGAAAEPAAAPMSYAASAEDLLDGWSCDGAVYSGVDVATAALDLATRCRHPALKVRASDFPPTGVVLDAGVTYAGRALGDALAELAKLATESGVAVGFGTDPNGFIFFRPNTDVLRVAYYDGLFENLPTSVKDGIATAFDFIFGGAPSIGEWAGGYQPGTLSYLTVPDVALHERYMRQRGRDIPQSAWTTLTETDYTAVGFSNPQHATDADLSTRAVRGSSGTPTLTLTNDDPWVYGIRLGYTLSDDAPDTKLRITPRHALGLGPYFEVTLPKSDLEDKPLDIKLPPALASAQGAFQLFESFKITAPVGGTFELYQAHLLRVDTAKLDALARADLTVPARRPQRITPLRETPLGPSGYVAPLAAEVEIPDTPYGTQRGTVAAVEYVWNDEAERVECILDLEQEAADEEATLVRTVQALVERDLNAKALAGAAKRPL